MNTARLYSAIKSLCQNSYYDRLFLCRQTALTNKQLPEIFAISHAHTQRAGLWYSTVWCTDRFHSAYYAMHSVRSSAVLLSANTHTQYTHARMHNSLEKNGQGKRGVSSSHHTHSHTRTLGRPYQFFVCIEWKWLYLIVCKYFELGMRFVCIRAIAFDCGCVRWQYSEISAFLCPAFRNQIINSG